MALIKSEDGGGTTSDHTQACPHCGFPLTPTGASQQVDDASIILNAAAELQVAQMVPAFAIPKPPELPTPAPIDQALVEAVVPNAGNTEKDALFDAALRHEQHGDWDKAIELYEQAAKKWPEQATYAMNRITDLRERQSKYSQASPIPTREEEPAKTGNAKSFWELKGWQQILLVLLSLAGWAVLHNINTDPNQERYDRLREAAGETKRPNPILPGLLPDVWESKPKGTAKIQW